ncbi:hypothetical protein Salat_0711000 [Sesamum alatum]|uniref:PB1-like domain-containing protein n=1 Tax=Sesamum alatum TaxID=300844 RepID=A0AAE1YSM5_9LAMI|nr:hypothetical protein Salat_0711000 [Sesamum alatum]
MSLRHQVLVDFPDPKYAKYGNEPFVTIVMYHGGSIVHSPKPEYMGGTKCKFDFVDVFRISVEYLNTLGEKLGYQGPKSFYRLHLNTFRPLKYQTEIVSFTEGYSPHNTVFTIYLVCGETPNVEPQTEINVNKGKGVVVDDGDDTDLADDEWDEVFKIVDSVAEGIGQGDGQVESQNHGDA